MRPWRMRTRERALRCGGGDALPEVVYIFNIERYDGGGGVFWVKRNHSDALLASQTAGSQGRVSNSSEAFMQRD